MKTSRPSRVFLPLMALASQAALGDVVINEFQAATSNRQFRYQANGSPRLGWGPGWQDPKFVDASWQVGSIPMGFGFATPATDLGARMRGKVPSLYVRKTFTVSAANAASEEPIRLQLYFDDGFIAFVNGVEIARGNMAAKNSFAYCDQSAMNKHTQATKEYVFTTTALAKDLLAPGENVLAVQVQNAVAEDMDENVTSPNTTLRFEGKLFLGPGASAGGTDIPLIEALTDWKYFVGVCEPSGGVADPALKDSDALYEPKLVDWIELRNNGAAEVDLSGWSLTDDKDAPKKWTFPAGTKIAAGGYLVALADSYAGTGTGQYLHTNFALDADGGYIGLYKADGKAADQLDDDYPKQDYFHSYGRKKAGADYVYFAEPTPGKGNDGPELAGVAGAPKFSVPGGFHDSAVELKLETKTEGGVIRYTTDGSTPSESNGKEYTGPISIAMINNKTATVIRARTFKAGSIPSKVATNTYLVGQDPALKTLPVFSLVGDAGESFYKPNGVLSIQGGGTGETWTPKTIDDYYIPQMHGRPYERRTSMEILYGDAKQGENMQLDIGLRVAASPWSRLRYKFRSLNASPWTSSDVEKPSFNFFFRTEFGADRLEAPIIPGVPVRSFESLRVRAGKNEIGNPFVRDELGRRLLTDMGHIGSVGIFHTIYVNGSFKGFFNLVTRLREDYFQDAYGSDKPWDVRVISSYSSGDGKAYTQLDTALKKDLKIDANYQAAAKMIDMPNFVDYLILNIWGATWDWPQNNFVMARERSDTGVWHFYVWDAEGIMGLQGDHPATYNTIKTDLQAKSDPVPTIYKRLMLNPEFKLYFADRLQKQFFTPGGAFTDQNLGKRIEELKGELGKVMQFSLRQSMNVSPLTKWVVDRPKSLFGTGKHLEAAGLWPVTKTVTYNQHGGTVSPGFEVRMTAGTEAAPQGGDIYYTTDGSDPRLWGGAVNGSAKLYERGSAIVLQDSTVINARVKDGDSWSAVNEAKFLIGYVPATSENLLISEVMYKPAPPSASEQAAKYTAADFEFIELYNAATSGIDLTGLRFVEGVDFTFASGARLAAQSHGVLVSNREAFQMRYGNAIPILGVFKKDLSNSGEKIVIQDASYRVTIREFGYQDKAPWPTQANIAGYSLTLKAPDSKPDLNSPESWTASKDLGGSPGRAEGGAPQPVDAYQAWRTKHFSVAELADLGISGPNGDGDGDRWVNFAEYAFGSNPKDPKSTPTVAIAIESLEVDGKRAPYLVATFPQRVDDAKVVYTAQTSSNLTTWATASDWKELSRQAKGEGVATVKLRSAAPISGATYARLKAQLN